MKSPFPGMGPHLEQKWGEVRTGLIVYARNQLNAQLPDDLQATSERYVAVQVGDEYSHSLRLVDMRALSEIRKHKEVDL